MARARMLKPSFFTDEDLGELPPLARLLFAGLWTVADRQGRLEDRPKRLKVELLPWDECDAEALLTLLALRGLIIRYEAQGRRYIQVRAFAKHQHPHVREPESTIPAPGQHQAGTGPALVEHDPGPAESESESESESGSAEGARAPKPPAPRKPAYEISTDAEKIRSGITAITGVKYPPSAFKALDARFNAGELTLAQAGAVVEACHLDPWWKRVQCNPETIFRPKHLPAMLALIAKTSAPPRQVGVRKGYETW